VTDNDSLLSVLLHLIATWYEKYEYTAKSQQTTFTGTHYAYPRGMARLSWPELHTGMVY